MGSEGQSGLWGTVRKQLEPYGRLGRLENSVEAGWSDVVYCLSVPARPAVTGFLELKHLAGWPVRPGTAVNVPHLTVEQVLFLEGWTAAGSRADLLMQVDRDYVLLDACGTRSLYEHELTKAHVLMTAHVVGTRRFPTRELVRWLTRTGPMHDRRAAALQLSRRVV